MTFDLELLYRVANVTTPSDKLELSRSILGDVSLPTTKTKRPYKRKKSTGTSTE